MEKKLIVQNHNSGNRVFPGWAKKYPGLANIPGESAGAKALIVAVEEEDLDDVIKELARRKVSARLPDQLSKNVRKQFEKFFPSLFAESGDGKPEELRKYYLDQYKKLFKSLDADKKEALENFKPREASLTELEAMAKTLDEYVRDLLALRDKWNVGIKSLPKDSAKKLLDDISSRLGGKFNVKKAGVNHLKQAVEWLEATLELNASEEG